MKYNELNLRRQKTTSRVGRGIAAGRGKTAGRGTKGQGSRKSGNVRAGFEGGQTPLYMRIPKLRGFTSHHAKAETVYTGDLEKIKGAIVDHASLAEANLISSPFAKVKLLAGGELKAKKDVRLPAASRGAAEAVKAAGGSFKAVDHPARPAAKPKA